MEVKIWRHSLIFTPKMANETSKTSFFHVCFFLGAKIPKFARKKTLKFGSNEVAIFLARKQK
jgi:hypothetical protein